LSVLQIFSVACCKSDAVSADAEVLEPQPFAIPVCRDADDDWILATALAGKADALVTGDKDLLVLALTGTGNFLVEAFRFCRRQCGPKIRTARHF
jgi:predicted nucleic acid-binding protein